MIINVYNEIKADKPGEFKLNSLRFTIGKRTKIPIFIVYAS